MRHPPWTFTRTAGEGAERSEAGEGVPAPSVRFAPLAAPRFVENCPQPHRAERPDVDPDFELPRLWLQPSFTNGLSQDQGESRCRQSVAQICLALHPLKGGR
jgi:hypothetical protein